MSYLAVFDLDGVLFDTKELNAEAYRRAGLDTPVPDGAGPWKTWMPEAVGSLNQARRIHSKKHEEYRKLVKEVGVRGLAPLELLKKLGPECRIATSASQTAYETLMIAADLRAYMREPWFARTGASSIVKSRFLVETMLHDGAHDITGVYVDDNRERGLEVVAIANCASYHLDISEWQFVHYRGQSYEELRTEMELCAR